MAGTPQIGLTARASPPRESSVAVAGDAPLADLAAEVVDGLQEELVDALDEVPGSCRQEHRAVLAEAGVDALDGRLAGALARAAEDPEGRVDDAQAVLSSLGHGHVDGQASGLDDVHAGLPPLLAAASTTPTVAVRLGVGWASRRREQRADLLAWITSLAMGARVVLVVESDAAARRLLDAHAVDVPAHILTYLRKRRSDTEAHVDAEAVDEATRTLDADGRPAGVLRALSGSQAHALDYAALRRSLTLDSPPYESVRRLVDRECVERVERADGTTVVSLRPVGAATLRRLDGDAEPDGGRAARSASSSGWDASGGEAGVSHTPQNPPDMPCCPAAGDGPPRPGDDDADRAARPAAEAATADGDRRDAYQTGLVTPAPAPRMDWVPAVEAADAGEVALVDADLSRRLDHDRDGRQPWWGFETAESRAYAAAEYHNPMQYAVSLAHALTAEGLLERADLEGRVGDGLRDLSIHERPVLWGATCVGWLPADVDDGAALVDAMREAREEVLELATLASRDGSEVSRGAATRHALGLVGTMTDLFDLAGVEVVVEARVPECSRHFGEANEDRREDLLEHLGTLSALCSRVGAYSTFRQLFEDRADRRSDALTLGFDRGEQACTGSLTASVVVVGDGVEGLAEDLGDVLEEPRPLVDDAPPVGVDVPLRVGSSGRRTARTVRRMLRSRGLRPTPEAVMVMQAFAADPWAAAEGIHWGLSTEDSRRDVHLDEVRRALSAVGPGGILPEMAPSARGGVAALLDADAPLSQAALARRAGISPQSWRTHRDALEAADVVRETADGWRVALPFRDERGEAVDVARPPWWLQGDGREGRKRSDVLWWLLVERGLLDDESRQFDPADPVGHALEVVDAGVPRAAVDGEAWRAALDEWGLSPWMLAAGCGDGPPPMVSTARMGDPPQSTLPV